MKKKYLSLILLFISLPWAYLSANDIIDEPLTLSGHTLHSKPTTENPDFKFSLHFSLPDGHFAYIEKLQVSVDDVSKNNLHISEILPTPIITFDDPLSKKIKEGTTGAFSIIVSSKLDQSMISEAHLLIDYQVCTKKYCYLPQQMKYALLLNAEPPSKFDKAIEQSWILAFFVVFLSGFLTSLTPCVFPVIPLTLAVLGTGESRNRKSAFFKSLSYVFGIAIMYALLGVFAASTGSLFGSMLGNKSVIFALVAIFTLMALSMFGHFEIKLSDSLSTKLNKKKFEKSNIGAFFSGLLAGVIVGPCVGPVLVSVLAYVAQTQSPILGFFLLFTFAMGMGILFLALGTFSELRNKLPKSGPWMTLINYVFGLSMLGISLYLLNPLISNQALNIIVIVFGLIAFIHRDHFQWKGHQSKAKRIKQFLALCFLLISIYSFIKLIVTSNTSLPADVNVTIVKQPLWHKYSKEKFAELQSLNKPIIFDFKAEWCAACKELELLTFGHSNILEIEHEFSWVYFDATEIDDEFNELKEKYNIIGLPRVLFYDRNGNWRSELSLTGFEGPIEFKKRLEKLQAL